MEILVHAYGRGNRDPITTLTRAKAWYTEKEPGWTHFESDDYDRLRNELKTTLEREKRLPIGRKLQDLTLDECFTIPVAEAPQIFSYPQYVKGFRTGLDNATYMGDVWLDK